MYGFDIMHWLGYLALWSICEFLMVTSPSARNAECHLKYERIVLTCGNDLAEWEDRRPTVNPRFSCMPG